MAITAHTTTTFSNEYQKYFSKELLKYAVQALVLDQFGQKAQLPRNTGTKAIRFFRFGAPATSGIQTLTEGTVIANSRTLTQSVVDISLVQYGQVIQLSDILTQTDFFNSMAQATKTNGEDAALHCDTIVRGALVGATSPTKRYAQAAATFAALIAASVANTTIKAADILDSCTQLRINRSPTIGGNYVGIICPQVARDVMVLTEWLTAKQYSDTEDLYKGELGSLYGVRFVQHTNPHQEDETEATAGTPNYVASGSWSSAGSNTTGMVYTTVITGANAYGVPELTGNSPLSPQVIITDKADKADPLNQTINVGFKTYYGADALNTAYYLLLRSRATNFPNG